MAHMAAAGLGSFRCLHDNSGFKEGGPKSGKRPNPCRSIVQEKATF